MNKCIFLGRITKEVAVTFAQGNGTTIGKFSIAVPRKFKKDETDFFNIVAFGKTADNIAKYFTKGSLILLETHAQAGSYEAKDGTKRYTMDFIADSFDFVGANNNNGNTEAVAGAGATEKPASSNMGLEEMTPVYDEDMPF